MKTLKLLILFLMCVAVFSACEKYELNEPGSRKKMEEPQLKSSGPYSPNNWMGALDNSLKISQLSIPGTHNSRARHEVFPGTAKCQNLTISEQLNNGVRFLDIRCRHFKDAFTIHHGSVYQKANFNDVLDACLEFLENNPTECIIMSVREEHKAADNTRSFEETFDRYVNQAPASWELGNSIPHLGDVRGKIVLFRRFKANDLPKGIHATYWKDKTTFTINSTAKVRVQDVYRVGDKREKWNNILPLLEEAKSGAANTLYVNFTSAYKPGVFGIPDITTISDHVNPKLRAYFIENTPGRYGAVLMDFVEPSNCELIIKTNF